MYNVCVVALTDSKFQFAHYSCDCILYFKLFKPILQIALVLRRIGKCVKTTKCYLKILAEKIRVITLPVDGENKWWRMADCQASVSVEGVAIKMAVYLARDSPWARQRFQH